jgi:putative phosphoesterase
LLPVEAGVIPKALGQNARRIRKTLIECYMKIVIISDLHGNLEALTALTETYAELWVLGDLVNYGPNPAEVVEWVRTHATVVVRGNHDNAAGFGDDPRCSAPFRAMAKATGEFTNSILSEAQKQFLRELPLSATRKAVGTSFFLCHAVPSDPLFGYCPPASPRWQTEAEAISADVLLVGHTHLPFVRSAGTVQIVNPGSLGQPKNGSAEACFAIWQDGQIELRSFRYELDVTLEKIRALPVSPNIKNDLIAVLRTGGSLR